MSYNIELKDPVIKETILLDAPHYMQGGTFAHGGTREAWINVTYNYAMWYRKPSVFPGKGIRSIYGLTGAESIPVLKNAIGSLERLDEDIDDEEKAKYKESGIGGYWVPTRENAIKPLYQLLALAQMRPDGFWEGD